MGNVFVLEMIENKGEGTKKSAMCVYIYAYVYVVRTESLFNLI